jgi:hypothetical protein
MELPGAKIRWVVEIEDEGRAVVLFQQLNRADPLEQLDNGRLRPTVRTAREIGQFS